MAPPIVKQTEVPKSPAETGSEIDQLRKENERLRSERAQMEAAMLAAAKKAAQEDFEASKSEGRSFRNAQGQLINEKYKGTKSYRVRQPHYRLGRTYQPGEIITVTDEKPSKTWVPVEVQPVTAIVDAPEPAAPSRPADQQV